MGRLLLEICIFTIKELSCMFTLQQLYVPLTAALLALVLEVNLTPWHVY